MSSGDDITIRLSVSGHESIAYSVFKVVGEEEISRLFEFVVDCTAPVPFQDLPPFVHQSATLEITRAGHTRVVAGMVSEVQEFGATPDRRFILRLVLVPRLYRLTLSRQNQVLATERAMTVPEVIEAELTANDLKGLAAGGLAGRMGATDYRLLLSRTYPEREYMVQLEETDFAFICRWAERDGIFFFFRVENGADVVIFGDRRFAFDDDGVTLPSRSVSGLLDRNESAVLEFSSTVKALPKKIILRDHNYRMPSVPLTVEAEVDPNGHGTVVEHGGYFSTDKESRELAQIRAEEMVCRHRLFSGKSNYVGLSAGTHFTLADHFPPVVDGTYLAVKVRHEITRTTSELANHAGAPVETRYSNSFECIPDNIEYRPERRTPWPKMPGLTKAKIDGESDGRRADLDHEGRYRIRRNADMRDVSDGQASLPVRKAEPFGGDQIGMHMPLLKGTEIVLSHVNGDPDRPMIIGAIPNTLHPSQVTGDAPHYNRIKTPSGVMVEIDDGHPIREDANAGRDGDGAFRAIVPGQEDDGTVRSYIRAGKARRDDALNIPKTFLNDGSWSSLVGENAKDLVSDGLVFATEGDLSVLVHGDHIRQVDGRQRELIKEGVTSFIDGMSEEFVGAKDKAIGLSPPPMPPLPPLPGLPPLDALAGGAALFSYKAQFKDPILKTPNNVELGIGSSYKLTVGNKTKATVGTSQDFKLAATTSVSMALESLYKLGVKQTVSLAGELSTTSALKGSLNTSLDYKWSGALGIELLAGDKIKLTESESTHEVYPTPTALPINAIKVICTVIIQMLGAAAGGLAGIHTGAGMAYTAQANSAFIANHPLQDLTDEGESAPNPLSVAGIAALGGSTVVNALVSFLQVLSIAVGAIYVIYYKRDSGEAPDPKEDAAEKSMDSAEDSTAAGSGGATAGTSTVAIKAAKEFAKQTATLAKQSSVPKVAMTADPLKPEDLGVLIGYEGNNYIHITPLGIRIVATKVDIVAPWINTFGMLSNVGSFDQWGRTRVNGPLESFSLNTELAQAKVGNFLGLHAPGLSAPLPPLPMTLPLPPPFPPPLRKKPG